MSDRSATPPDTPPGKPPMTPIRTVGRGLPPVPASRRSLGLRRLSGGGGGTSPISTAAAATFEEGAYAWLPDAEDVFVPVRVQKPFRKGEKGLVVRLRPNEASFHNEEEVNRRRRLSIGSRQRHHLRPSITTIELTPEETEDLVRADDTSLVPTANMIDMVDLSEATLLHNLRLRFFEKCVYTAIGTILVSVNPFEALPLYTPEIVEKYRQAGSHLNRAKLGPHVYAMAHDAFANMIEHRQDQSCIVTGESGSGKTEFTKLFLQYLMEVSKLEGSDEGRLPDVNEEEVVPIDENDDMNLTSAEKDLAALPSEDFSRLALSTRILTANPLLEAFGNAATLRNDNSSRFGKWISVAFHKKKGIVLGANIQVYLLEKSRLVHRGKGERTFHIFYQMLAGAAADTYLRESLQLEGGLESFKYLSGGDATKGDDPVAGVAQTGHKSVSDVQSWAQTLRSLRSLGTTREEEAELLQVLAGLLHLGNVQFAEEKGPHEGASVVENKDVLDVASELLGLDSALLETSLTKKDVSNSKERIFQNRSANQAREARDALAKHIYARLFDWIVGRIGVALGPAEEHRGLPHSTIGMLDVFGFEVFARNSFEQLCINYANEKLQEQFNRKVFEMERKEYLAQGMAQSEVDVLFTHISNAQCLALFEEKPNGVFAALEDEIFIPKGTDAGFVSKLAKNAAATSRFVKIDGTRFRIMHYAGDVEYDAETFLEKSRDRIDPALEQVPQKSLRMLVSQIQQAQQSSTAMSSTPPKKKEQKTLGTKFMSQLSDLLDALDSTEPHYARCIKPNDLKSSAIFRAHMVMDQLRYAGLLDVCRVRKRGYPVRLEFEEFAWRYGNTLLGTAQTASTTVGNGTTVRSKCEAILNTGGVKSDEAFVGKSKVLLRHACYDALEMKRDEALRQRATLIQKLARGRLSRISVAELKTALTRLAQITGNPGFSEKNLAELEEQLAACRDVPTSHPIISTALALKKKLEGRQLVLEMIAKAKTEPEARIAKKEALSIGIASDDPCLAFVNALLQRKSEETQLKAEVESAMEARSLERLSKALAEINLIDGTERGRSSSTFTQEFLSDARAMHQRLQKETEATAIVEKAIADDVSADQLKSALKMMITLGMEKHPIAVSATKLLRKKKRKENESKDLTMLRAQGTEDVKQALSKLKLAESTKDLKAIAEARTEAIEKGLDRVPDVQRAARLIQQLEDENDSETSLAVATEFVQAKAGLKSGTALTFHDLERLAEAISVARQRGISLTSPQYVKAVETESSCRSQLKVQLGLEDAMKERDYNKVNSLLLDATQLNMDNDLVRRARAVSSRRAESNARIGRTVSLQDRALEIKRMSQTDFERRRIQRLAEVRRGEHDWWDLGKFNILRTEEDFASKIGAFFSVAVNKKVAKSRLQYSGKVIPKSLTIRCGKDERVAKRAVLMNKAILGFCGDLVLPFPTVLVQQILEAALLDAPLADELWVQLLRQLTLNPYEDSERKAWMLCAICASCLGPASPEVENTVLSFFIASLSLPGLGPIDKEYARYALRQFEKTVLEGPSGAIPSQEEIAAFQERPPMLATVNLPDGSELTREYPVAPDVTVQDLVEACCATYNIRTDLAFLFGLFVEVRAEDVSNRRTAKLKRMEIATKLESGTVPVTLLPAPPPGPPPSAAAVPPAPSTARKVTFNLEPEKSGSMIRRVSASMMTLKKKASVGGSTKHSMSSQAIISEEEASDIVRDASSEEKPLFPRSRSMGSKIKSMGNRTQSAKIMFAPSKSKLARPGQMPPKVPEPLPSTDFLGDVFTHGSGRGERLQFVFRRKIVSPIGQEPPGAMKEKPFVEICFLEAVHEHLLGNWACQTKEDVAELAVLMLSEARGGRAPQTISPAMTNAVQEFIPLPWRSGTTLTNSDWARLITAAGNRIKVTSARETRKAFLSRIGLLPTYGLICFPVRRSSSQSIILGCGAKGLYLLQDDATRTEIAFIPHIRLRQIGAFAESVFMDVWDDQHTKVKERLTFVSSQGHEIAALLWELGVKFS